MIDKLGNVTQSAPLNMKNEEIALHKNTDTSGFKTALSDALKEVSKTEHISDQKTELLAQGKIDDLHEVMIAAQKATVTVEATVQVQQKVIDIYNEMMRMQV